MEMQLFPVHRATHPGTATSAPFATDKQEPTLQSRLAQEFCTLVPFVSVY